MRRNGRVRLYVAAAAGLLAVFVCGCGTKMVVVPQVDPAARSDFRIFGKILYEGRKDYLPATVADDNSANPRLAFKYSYDTAYGDNSVHQAVALFNPLTLVGFPIGGNTFAVGGTLEVIKEEKVVKSYSSTCGFDVTRNLFYEGDTYTELRREGLLAVKRNIEAQMYIDREYLASLKVP